MMKIRFALAAVAAVSLLAGCGETPEDPADGSLRFVHAAAGLGGTTFLLEERSQGTLSFADASAAFPLDSGQFDLHVETLVSDAVAAARTVSVSATIQAEQQHTFVLYEDNGALSLQEYVAPQAAPEGTNVDIRLLNAIPGSTGVDFYIEADGANLAAATPRGSQAYKQISDTFTITSGEYRLTITTAGDSADVLFQSGTLTLNDATSTIMAVFPGAGQTNAAIRAASLASTASSPLVLLDTLAQPQLKTVNASAVLGAVDVVVDGDFANPLHPAVASLATTAYVPLTGGQRQIQVTPAGNMGVIETDQTADFTPAINRTQVLAGPTGSVVSSVYVDDNRGFKARARYRLRHGGRNVPAINFYLHDPGADVTELPSQAFNFPVSGTELNTAALPDDYEITVVLNDGDSATEDTTIVAGPVAVTFAESRVYEILLIDSATAGMLDIQVTDVTAPAP